MGRWEMRSDGRMVPAERMVWVLLPRWGWAGLVLGILFILGLAAFLGGCAGISQDQLIGLLDDLEGFIPTPTATPGPTPTPEPMGEPSQPVLVSETHGLGWLPGIAIWTDGYPAEGSGSISLTELKFYSCDTGEVIKVHGADTALYSPAADGSDLIGSWLPVDYKQTVWANGNWLCSGHTGGNPGHMYTSRTIGDGSRRGKAVCTFERPGTWLIWYTCKATENRASDAQIAITLRKADGTTVTRIYQHNQRWLGNKHREFKLWGGEQVRFAE